MNKGILKRYSLGVLYLIGLLASCSEEPPATLSTGKPVEIRLQVNAPLGSVATNPETVIRRLRMVVFGSVGASDAGKLVLNKYYPIAPTGNSLKEIITSGRRDIYLIANEPLGGGGEELDDYKNIATVATMRTLSLVYQGAGSVGNYTPTEIPMFAEQLNQLLKVDALNNIGGSVERTMAKVTLNLNIKNANFAAGKPVVIDHITIKNLPKSSSLIAQSYTGDLVTSEQQAVGAAAAASGYDFFSLNTFYLPEYLFDDPDKGAYIEIIGHIKGEPNKVKYKVKLGDAMDDAHAYGDKYHITRNRHYTFTGDVKSYGEVDGVAVKVMVAPWNTVNMDEEIGRYITFDGVNNATGNLTDGSNLDDTGDWLRVGCRTNIGGWYTVTRDSQGTIVHRSAATESVSRNNSYQSVEITIPKLWALPDLQSYTVSIYHRTIAPEAVGPVKRLNFTQYGFFIPNAVLEINKWPKDKLPAHGLQIAKRGNSGVAGSDDPGRQWKTSFTSTPGTAAGLGTGVSNTAAMAGAEHPAAQYCRDMGEGWFLPSKDELYLIATKGSVSDVFYRFTPESYYWTSTENYAGGSFTVYFSHNVMFSGAGTHVAYRVRCVRLI